MNNARHTHGPQEQGVGENSGRLSPFFWMMIVCFLAALIVSLLPRPENAPSKEDGTGSAAKLATTQVSADGKRASSLRQGLGSGPALTAEQIVAGKLSQFGRSRHDIVHAISRRSGKDVPPEIEAFFDAVEEGNWDQIHTLWQALAKRSGQYDYSTHSPELDEFWPAVLEAYGAAEAAHLWPAQKLLDYGDGVLGALRPGMVYVGGTDPGRFIPTFLNETIGSEPHVVLTQNALADGRYQDYLRFLYSDQIGLPTAEDSQRAFQEYTTDAQKRLEHDQQFPDEPKQVRPGEKIEMTDGKVQVSGQVAVMLINERLLQMILDQNPDATFALEESFPLKTTYAGAAPLGPLMELRADTVNAVTADSAAQSVDYWRTMTQQLLAEPDLSSDSEVRKAYGHMAQAQANLLADHNFNDQAEQAYRLASTLSPDGLDPVKGLSELLAREGRGAEAVQLLDEFERNHPKLRSDAENVRASIIVAASQGAK
jgi:hypothetical protein